MAKRSLLMLLGLFLVVVLVAAPASANVAWEWSTTTVDASGGTWSFGAEFNIINAPFTVTYLGFYDDRGDGLTEAHDVGIWDSAQNLLTSATVVPTDPLIGHFRWHAVSPSVVLPISSGYRIAAETGTVNFTYNTIGFFTDPSVEFVNSAYTLSAILVYPVSSDSNIGYFGPNFSDVPVPPSVLMLGSGLLGLAGLRRKFSR